MNFLNILMKPFSLDLGPFVCVVVSFCVFCTFLLHDAMLGWYMLSSCVHLSVHLSQVGVLLRWLNLGSTKQCYKVPRHFSFLVSKITAKFQWGAKQRWGRLKVAIFDKYDAISQK